ncbi:hypothetical protein PO002_11045 [Cupriavidus necator]|uniref:hypothetical protein n=1 Tax=Cupriavidus necator TaxID=106590 RepID=UPI0039C08F65
MAIQEGVRRIAVVIKVIGWIWLIGWLVGGAVSAFAAQPQDKWWESYPIVEQPKPGTPVPASDLPDSEKLREVEGNPFDQFDAPADPVNMKGKLQQARAAGYSDNQIRQHLGVAPSKDLSSASNEELLAALEAKSKEARADKLRQKLETFAIYLTIALLGFAVCRTTAWVLDGFVDRRQT